jgi:hypothetical protein
LLQIVNAKGEMKGSAITGPVGKEAAELWPVRFPFHSLKTLGQKNANFEPNSVLPATPAS